MMRNSLYSKTIIFIIIAGIIGYLLFKPAPAYIKVTVKMKPVKSEAPLVKENPLVKSEYENYEQPDEELANFFRNYKIAEKNVRNVSLEKDKWALLLAQGLTERLRQKKFSEKPVGYAEHFGQSGFINHSLYLDNAFVIVKEINDLECDNPIAVEFEDGIADYLERREAIVAYAREVAPDYKNDWLVKQKGQWCDASGLLWSFLTEDQIAPSELGLNAEQTFNLLNRCGRD